MSQQAEREQGENTDEAKSGSGTDRSDDQAMEAQSNARSSSCADITEPSSEVLSEDMQDIKNDIVNKEINENQQKRILKLEEKLNEVIENQQKRISKLEEKLNEVIENQQKRISELEENINKAERKLNLWLYGLREKEGENVKKLVITICRAAVPEAADDFTQHIDTVQRIGKRSEEKARPVIIRFIARSTKELLWKTAKRSEYLRSRNLWFAEDLTAKDKETRNKLWPQIEAARKDGKKAFFVGAKAVIEMI